MEKGDVKKASSLMMTAVFAFLMLFFTLGYFVFFPTVIKVQLIELEKKAELPDLTINSVTDGSFEKQLEDYMCDHITQRPFLIALSIKVNKILGRTYQRGIYIADDGYLIRESHFTEDDAREYAAAVSTLAEECEVPVDLLIIPESGIMLRDKLPLDVTHRTFDEADKNAELLAELVSDKVNVCYAKEPIQELIDEGTQAYYRTDHHWTTDCAKAVYEWYTERIGLGHPNTEYEIHSIPDSYGHIYSLLPQLGMQSEEIRYYVNPKGEYTVSTDSNNTRHEMIFLEAANNIDNYRIFFGGDQKYTEISSNAPKGNMLVINDSFGRAFLPFLADSCSEIFSVDLRQFDTKKKSVAQLCRERGAERLLIIHYTDTFSDKRVREF